MRVNAPLFHRMAVLSIAVSVIAQTCQAAQVNREPRAVELLEQAYAATAAVPAGELRDTVTQARIHNRGDAAPTAVTFSTRGSAIRMESERHTAVVARGRSSVHADTSWRRVPDANAHHRLPEHMPTVVLASLLQRTDFSLIYLGQVTADGKFAHQIRAVPVFSFPAGTNAEFIKQLTSNGTLDI